MADTVVVFKALQLANEQRNAYGLRYNDFARYRKHCANRTHRLRSTLKMTHGKGREFKKLPPLTPETVKDGHLQLLLLEAERAWAYSQELSAQALVSTANATTLRHSATGRFRRAVSWSTQLLSLCQSLFAVSRLSAAHLLQVSIYTLVLNARFLRHRDEFDDALVQLSVARGLLDELANNAETSREQALAAVFADEVGPEIRYCAHELGRAKAYDVDGIVAELAGKHRNEMVEGCDAIIEKLKAEAEGEKRGAGGSRKKLAELSWEGQPVPVRNPELVDVLLKVQEAETRLEDSPKKSAGSSKKGIAAYDAILLALSDAEEVARKLVEAQQLTGSTSTGAAGGTRDIHFVHAYIVYQLLSRRIQRDLLLVSALLSSDSPASSSRGSSKASSPSTSTEQQQSVDVRLFPALVKLLDTVLQSLIQMRALSIVDDSPDLAAAVEARVAFTKARRCLFLARSYAAVPVRRYAEALTLVQHAGIYVREAQASLSLYLASEDEGKATTAEPAPAHYPLPPSSLQQLERTLASEALALKRTWFAFNGGAADAVGRSEKKPLFFDVALNYVALDVGRLRGRAGLDPLEDAAPSAPAQVGVGKAQGEGEKKAAAREAREDVEEPEVQKPQPAKGGLSNLLGGWWGRS
ncbi:hypothetical protein C8F04DRAFT_1048859 [Mycena alexandri]|uniref:Signal recognition particle subunit SRP68 n=1 Tax=Mycena alexandri TaxID=1745969 RepID=A0AAD6WRJ1_9AGAR|nr:hypothetical protein C8F04DRAFT_1048859 [Mycena alexandri]